MLFFNLLLVINPSHREREFTTVKLFLFRNRYTQIYEAFVDPKIIHFTFYSFINHSWLETNKKMSLLKISLRTWAFTIEDFAQITEIGSVKHRFNRMPDVGTSSIVS